MQLGGLGYQIELAQLVGTSCGFVHMAVEASDKSQNEIQLHRSCGALAISMHSVQL